MYPKHPNVMTYTKDLKDMIFPISFKLCVGERENATDKFKRLGYTNQMDFFHGRSRFNKNQYYGYYGWNGHTKYNSTLGSVMGIVYVSRYQYQLLFWVYG